MVKETKFDHQIVRIVKGLALGTEQEFGGIIMLDFKTSNFVTVVSGDTSITWLQLHLAGSYTVPAAARAVILDVACRDAAGVAAGYYVQFGNPCGVGAPIRASETQIVYAGDVNDRWNSRIVIVEMNDDTKINYQISASGAVFDWNVKLIGWVLDPYTARVTPPSADLKATLVVNQ